MIIYNFAELSVLELIFEVRAYASPLAASEQDEDLFSLFLGECRSLFDRSVEPGGGLGPKQGSMEQKEEHSEYVQLFFLHFVLMMIQSLGEVSFVINNIKPDDA